MITDSDRYDRQLQLLGAEGQARLGASRVGIIGLGGLGCHIAQQLAYLGVRSYALIDGDRVSAHSLNRLITACPEDVDKYKTDLAERLIRVVQPGADVVNVRRHLPDPEARAATKGVDLLVAGVDNDAPRLLLTELASKDGVVYIDAATDTYGPSGSLAYGGRVITAGIDRGCLYCLGHLDQRQIRHAAMTEEERAAEAAIYGVPVDLLDATGPSVVTLNAVVASLAAMEAMVYLTGLRAPNKQLTYRADQGGVRLSLDSPSISVCPYCARWAPDL